MENAKPSLTYATPPELEHPDRLPLNLLHWAILIPWLVVLMLIGVADFGILRESGGLRTIGVTPPTSVWGLIVPLAIGCVAFVALPALFVIVLKGSNRKPRFWPELAALLFSHITAFAMLAMELRHLSRMFWG